MQLDCDSVLMDLLAWQPFRLIGHPLPLRPIFCCSAPHLNLEITGAMTPLL